MPVNTPVRPASPVPVVMLMGPTASGKTGLSLALHAAAARGALPYAGVDLISVDSAQVFRGMDIGTAKPAREILERVPHQLIDLIDPAETYSAASFLADAVACIERSRGAGRLPVLVGGTGLYFRALEFGLAEMPQANPAIRARLTAEGQSQGWPALHSRLAAVDPDSAAKIKPNDPQRLIRALEIFELTGKNRSAHWLLPKAAPLAGPLLKFALMPPSRQALHEAIEKRFLQMMDDGLLAEVRALKARADLHLGLPSMRAVGYRQLWEHLDGLHGLEQAVQLAIIATRQYSKRQMTWLKSEQNLQWLNAHENGALDTVIAGVLATSSRAQTP